MNHPRLCADQHHKAHHVDELPQDFGDMTLPQGNGLPDMGLPDPIARLPAKLTQQAKAAVIVRLLASQDVTLPLGDFPEAMQVQLASNMSEMRHIDKDTLTAVVEEFLAEIEAVGLSFPGGLEGALNVLEGTISPITAAKLRKNAGFALTGDPWERIQDLDAQMLLPILGEESVEVGAVLLSKLKVAKSAELLSLIPGERARRIAYAISLTAAVAPEVVQRIGISIAAKLDARPAQAFSDAPTERVGAILNSTASATREGVLEGLDEADSEFAQEVRKNIFTYANIATRVAARDIAKVIRAVEADVLVKALAGATGPAARSTEFILENMSKRMADGLREEMAEAGTLKDADVDEAMTTVVTAIRELETNGEIFLMTGDDE